MRVLTIINSLAVGGSEQSLAALTPFLVERGVESHVGYLTERPGLGPEVVAGGATLHSLEGGGGRLGAVVRTRRLIQRIEPDLVHTTLFEGDIVGRTAALFSRVPVISSFVTESYGPEHFANPEYRAWKVRGAQVVDAVTARAVKRFHAVSGSAAAVMARRLRIRSEQIEVISRGRDPQRLGVRTEERRQTARRGLGIAVETPLVLAAGRHHYLKGLDTLVRAFPKVVATVPQAQLVIAGREGPATAELADLIASGGIEANVHLLGYRSDLADLMCGADVFVIPSRAEGSPGVLIEAMALEVPTVASDIASISELAGDGPPTMRVVGPAPDSLADGILELLADGESARTLAEAARRRFLDRYTLDAIADATITLYGRTLAD